MKAVFTIEQLDGKLVITIEQAEPIIKEQDGIDWSKPQPFPEGYEIPEGVKVSLIEQADYPMPLGLTGITQNTDSIPYIDWQGGRYRSKDVSALEINGGKPVISNNLAPINPTDHPLHPDFKGNK
jgi:hypothetical protein